MSFPTESTKWCAQSPCLCVCVHVCGLTRGQEGKGQGAQALVCPYGPAQAAAQRRTHRSRGSPGPDTRTCNSLSHCSLGPPAAQTAPTRLGSLVRFPAQLHLPSPHLPAERMPKGSTASREGPVRQPPRLGSSNSQFLSLLLAVSLRTSSIILILGI